MELKDFTNNEKFFDSYVSSHPNGDVLQTTFWGHLKIGTDWKYLPLAVLEKGQIIASALILIRKLPFIGKTIFYSPRGPLFSNIESLHFLLSGVKKLAKKHKAILWKMDPALEAGHKDWQKIENTLVKVDTGLDFLGVQPKFVMTLDITPSLDTIMENMKSKTRYNIRYAQRKGVTVSLATKRNDIEKFYPLLLETAKRDGFTVRSKEYFYGIWDCLVSNNIAQLFLAHHEGDLLSATIAFRLGKRAWYVYGASSNHKRNLQPNHAIQWEMIKWAKGFGCTVYDFRGISGDLNPENPLYGLYRFKDGFGAKVVEYVGEYDLVFSRAYYPFWTRLLPLYKNLRGKPRNDT